MASFSDLRKSFKLQQQAMQVRKELKNIHVEAVAEGVKVVISADTQVVDFTITPEVLRERIPSLAIDALNRALKKAQIVSAERMQEMMKEMGMAG